MLDPSDSKTSQPLEEVLSQTLNGNEEDWDSKRGKLLFKHHREWKWLRECSTKVESKDHFWCLASRCLIRVDNL